MPAARLPFELGGFSHGPSLHPEEKSGIVGPETEQGRAARTRFRQKTRGGGADVVFHLSGQRALLPGGGPRGALHLPPRKHRLLPDVYLSPDPVYPALPGDFAGLSGERKVPAGGRLPGGAVDRPGPPGGGAVPAPGLWEGKSGGDQRGRVRRHQRRAGGPRAVWPGGGGQL